MENVIGTSTAVIGRKLGEALINKRVDRKRESQRESGHNYFTSCRTKSVIFYR